jgi:hypothetical protein
LPERLVLADDPLLPCRVHTRRHAPQRTPRRLAARDGAPCVFGVCRTGIATWPRRWCALAAVVADPVQVRAGSAAQGLGVAATTGNAVVRVSNRTVALDTAPNGIWVGH